MKKYPKYKDSGVEWIGEIPDGWVLKRLKYISFVRGSNVDKHIFEEEKQVLLCNYTDVYYNEKIDNSTMLSLGSCSEEEFKKFQIKQGDVIITKDSETPDDIGIPCFISEELTNTICGYHLSMITPDLTHVLGGYLFRQFQTERIQQHYEVNSFGITRYGLGKSIIENTDIILPPLPEQTQIFEFLDQKTTIIDDLIQKKYRKIELLKEHRTSIINHTVTKGLNPDVKMKDSGVEWIGDIPEDWVISKFKYDSSIPVKYGLNISGDSYKEEGIRFIRITDLTENGDLIETDGKYLDENQVPNEFLLNKFDVLFCRSGHTVGKSYLHLNEGKYTSGGYLVRFNFRNQTESKFIFYVGKTDFYWDWIKLNSVISTIENVNGDKYQNFQYPKPPLQEQNQIVQYLDQKTNEIDTTITLENKKIDLLKEFRQSLISEVVTGKIDVRKN